jgi:hypothetical protein
MKETLTSITTNDTTSNTQVSVEPRVQKDTSVYLHTELPATGLSNVGMWLDAKIGRVGVCSNNVKRCSLMRRSTPRNNRAVSTDESGGGEVDTELSCLNKLVAEQCFCCTMHNVKWRWAGIKPILQGGDCDV